MTIRAVKPVSQIEFIRIMAEKSTKLSARMKDLIKTRPKKDTLYFFGECNTLEEIEAKAESIERTARKVLKQIGHEELIDF